MDNERKGSNNTNTVYIPEKCRVTKPPPPKPAANPLQFVKVGPCPLNRRAQEQIKKVDEIKVTRQEVREEAEDWQQNLDSWKNNRRKQQEHIIERVEVVKKLEQEGHDRNRRKTKTFSEMGNRSGAKRFIPVYDDDSNDLSDYGIGSSSSKTNSIKDVDTDDNSSVLDEKDNNMFDSASNKDFSGSNQSQSEDETNTKPIEIINNQKIVETRKPSLHKYEPIKLENKSHEKEKEKEKEYTYEGAIETYKQRTKVQEKLGDNKSRGIAEAETLLPKGNICKRKQLFEINTCETNVSRRLSEDFANTQSIKQRLQSLEKCAEIPLIALDKNELPSGNVKTRLQNFNKTNEADTKNNNDDNKKSIGNYLLEKTNSNYFDRMSPESDLFINKLNTFNRDLDTYYPKNGLDEFAMNYAPSTSSTELMDREDSGIHTADVSCSVSQSDEAFEFEQDCGSTIPNCIEKLTLNKPKEINKELITEFLNAERENALQFVQKIEHSPLVANIEKIELELEYDLPNLIKPIDETVFPPIIYENVDLSKFPMEFISEDVFANRNLQPPKVKPPPPPPVEENVIKRVNSTKRIKKELHIKRSSFLGLDEPTDEQIDPQIPIDKSPDIHSFLQKEARLEKTLYKKMQGSLSEVESQDSGLEIERSTDNWNHLRTDSEQANSLTSEEDEITKKEREIIELIEKEEKSRDTNELPIITKNNNYIPPPPTTINSFDGNLGSQKYEQPYFPQTHYGNLDDQDSEVLKVEHELLQLEREELERQRENQLYREKLLQNRHSYENICDVDFTHFQDNEYRKSLPELTLPVDYAPPLRDATLHNAKADDFQYRKSMPDIQRAFNRSVSEYRNPLPAAEHKSVDHRKSMPELQKDLIQRPNQAIMPGTPLRPPNLLLAPSDSDAKPIRNLTRNNIHALSAAPRSRHMPNDNWIQPKAKTEAKSYNQHWLCQEAELRRISEQKNAAAAASRNWPEKHIPDSVIHSLTQRVQNRGFPLPPRALRPIEPQPADFQPQHPYLGHAQTLGHALPMSYHPQTAGDSPEVVLSVSGKKKCSYCSNELGRGAAMIIESLCLFYHMECFKCCVCRTQLGDGLMGTDVRVRNQKLHCHNCYSSDDGIKFSCV